MSKIYLLTGAAGLLGCNIARQLVDAKEVVRALVLKDDPAVARSEERRVGKEC